MRSSKLWPRSSGARVSSPPAAILSCSRTRSRPLTSSETVCSTCKRGLTSRKYTLPFGVTMKFAGAQAHVADRGEQAAGVFLERADDFLGQEGRGCLFHEFLVAALQRAVTGGVHGEVAVRVAPGLGLDVACLVHELLDEVFLQIAALQRVVVHVEAAQLLVVMHTVMPWPPPPSVRFIMIG